MKPLWLTAYSATHHPLYEKHFKPSFDRYLANYFELQPRQIKGNPGKFGEKSFNDWGRREMGVVLSILQKNMGRFVVSTGCDFRFYADFYDEMKQTLFCKELAGINDVYGPLCGDFSAFFVTPKILNFYGWMIANDRTFSNQQFTFNAGLAACGIRAVSLSNAFYTVGMTNGGKVWKPGDPVEPPLEMRLHHGNFTVGAENKMAVLNAVLKQHESDLAETRKPRETPHPL